MCVTRSLVNTALRPSLYRVRVITIVQVASKCGIKVLGESHVGINHSASHIKSYIEGTIERFGFASDLHYLHRIEPVGSQHPVC